MSTLLRFKCPKCGKVQDVSGNGPCRKCSVVISLPEDGAIQIYRTGFPMGRIGSLMELYLNDIDLGLLKHGESIRIPVPYGHYTLRMKILDNAVTNNIGIPQEFDISPNNRYVFFTTKIVPGGWNNTVQLIPVTADQMPPL